MSSTTLEVLFQNFVEEYSLGRVGDTTATGDSTSLIDLTRFGGPFAGNEWGRGCPVRITSGARIGEQSYVDDYDPATGDFTLDPALTGAPATGANFVIGKLGVLNKGDNFDRILEALNRFLVRYGKRRMRVPLTFVPNGDYIASSASTGWTGTNATAAYVELAHPDGYYFRVLQNTSSAGDGRLTSTTLKAEPGSTWKLYTFNRVTTAGDEAKLVVQDETNSAAITLTVEEGDDTYSGLAWQNLAVSFTVPSTCYTISIRLQSTVSGDVSQWGPIVAAPQDTKVYTGQTALEYLKDVGQLWTHTYGDNPYDRQWSPVQYGRRDEQFGWGQAFTFEATPPFPLYAEMLMSYPELSADTDTTACPRELALAGMAVEFFRTMQHKDRLERGPDDRRTRWDDLLSRAEKQFISAESLWNTPVRPNVRKMWAGRAYA